MRDAQGWGSAAPTGITCPLPALSSASPVQHPSITQQIVGAPGPPTFPPPPPPPRARTAVEGVDPGQSRQAAVAQRLHALRSAPPAGSHLTTKAARGRRGAAGPGGGWLGAGRYRLPGRAAVLLLPGEPREGGAGWRWQCVPPPASASQGGAEPCVPRTQPRQLPAVPGEGRWGWWLYGHRGARLHAEPQATPEPMGGHGNTHLCHNLTLLPMLQGCPNPAKPQQLKDAQLPDRCWYLS